MAGLGAASELRRSGYGGRIILSDAQDHLPYDRPPLSKAFLHAEAASAAFHEEEHYREQGIELALGAAAVSLDAAERRVIFAGGRSIAADAIVIATGARARRLPAAIAPPGVHVVRDLNDAVRLREEMRGARTLVMIGGGFIGAEVASTAVKLGLDVTIIDAARLPLANVLGEAVAGRIAGLHESAGVRLELGMPVRLIAAEDGNYRVELSDGRTLESDIVVAGLGSVPNVEWLAGSGLDARDGVVCDGRGRTSAPAIFAAGDVAAWRDPLNGKPERHEHWTAAREQGRIVAQDITGADEANWSDFLPYFWSDIHGRRVQLLGTATGAERVEFAFDNPETGAFVAEFTAADRLIGVAGCNAAARVMRYSARLKVG